MTPCKAILIAAPASGSGKTLVTLALLRAFRNAGLRVASAKAGPDYIDPRFHEAATGRPCYNLDPWAMPPARLRGLLAALARDADLVIVEGVMGLFDGPAGGGGSTADLALALGLPVVLTVDCRHQAQSAAALVHGFASYRPDIDLAGVILNRVASPRHAALLSGALGNQVTGMIMNDPGLNLPSRHLGLVQATENPELESFIAKAAAKLGDAALLARIRELAAPVTPAPLS
ncbi:MAG: cobyrinate a,c-diamide synthase, partial [Aestuariivirga sp.]|uniref:cobyrinate a,c-diamide synthase n=1 Tax=Aestuariivirga sp. TaxID=2650926 RepID=UPI0038D1B1D2